MADFDLDKLLDRVQGLGERTGAAEKTIEYQQQEIQRLTAEVAHLKTRVSELEHIVAETRGNTVNVNTNNGIIGDDVKDNSMNTEKKDVKKPRRKKGGKDAGDGDKQ